MICSHLFPENVLRGAAGRLWCQASLPYLNPLMQLPGNDVKMLMGIKAAGRRLRRPHCWDWRCLVPGVTELQPRRTGWKTKALSQQWGRYTDGHRDFPFPGWEELFAETQMWLESCAPTSSKQLLEARSSSFKFRHLMIYFSPISQDKSGDPHSFYMLTKEQVSLPLGLSKEKQFPSWRSSLLQACWWV